MIAKTTTTKQQSFSVRAFEYTNMSFCGLWRKFYDFTEFQRLLLQKQVSKLVKANVIACSHVHMILSCELTYVALATVAGHITWNSYIPAGYPNYEEEDGHHITFIPVILHIQFKFFH